MMAMSSAPRTSDVFEFVADVSLALHILPPEESPLSSPDPTRRHQRHDP